MRTNHSIEGGSLEEEANMDALEFGVRGKSRGIDSL